MALPRSATVVPDRPSGGAGCGGACGKCCHSFRGGPSFAKNTAPPPGLLLLHNPIHVLLRDSASRLVEFRREPAHDHGRIGQLAGRLDDLENALLAAQALALLDQAIGAARQRHIELTLLAANAAGSHRTNSSDG